MHFELDADQEQLRASLVRLLQAQAPFAQVCVLPQALPHEPQLLASTLGFTQKPLQGAAPTAH